jgi:hypothetical protein
MTNDITCAICSTVFNGQIHPSHLIKHGTTTAEYKVIHGDWRSPAVIDRCREGAKNGGSSEGSKRYQQQKHDRCKENYYKNPRVCERDGCGQPIKYKADYRQKCCSKQCSYMVRSTRAIPKNNDNKCLICQTDITGYSVTCGPHCNSIIKRGESIKKWIDGLWAGGSDVGISDIVRDYLLEQANYKCSQCSWGKLHPKTGKSPLHIDHINGDCTDHQPDNLRVLCPNCHSLTDTFGAHNRGNKGRVVRRKERLMEKQNGDTSQL